MNQDKINEIEIVIDQMFQKKESASKPKVAELEKDEANTQEEVKEAPFQSSL